MTLDGAPLVYHAVRAALAANFTTVVACGPGLSPSLGRIRGRSLLTVDLPDHSYAAAVAALAGALRSRPRTVLVHDPSCPMLPPTVLGELARRAAGTPDAVHVLSRPVTDTVKRVRAGMIVETIPRGALRTVFSPVCAPLSTLEYADLARVRTLTELVDALAQCGPVSHGAAPLLGQGIDTSSDAALLEALRDLSEPSRS